VCVCRADGKIALDSVPFDLRTVYGLPTSPFESGSTATDLLAHSATARLLRLRAVVDGLYAATAADWIGIYTAYDVTAAGVGRALVKEAYRGEPSRALFPLSQSFAASSNNSAVGLSGRAVSIADVESHAGPYYKCSGRVLSELCIPIVTPTTGKIIGIIDLEAWHRDFFDDRRTAIAVHVCEELGKINAGRTDL
jgi:L-methionine (R)-S-oxide reductase